MLIFFLCAYVYAYHIVSCYTIITDITNENLSILYSAIQNSLLVVVVVVVCCGLMFQSTYMVMSRRSVNLTGASDRASGPSLLVKHDLEYFYK